MKTQTLLQQLLVESNKKYYFTTETANSVFSHVTQEMKHLADKYKEHEAKASKSAAAPNTSSFIATRSGMIEFCENVHIHGGQYGLPRTYRVFIKIGGNVKPEIFKKIEEDLVNIVAEFDVNGKFEIPGILNCSNGQLIFGTEDGTNWGGIGMFFQKHSDWSQKQYDEHTDQ